MRSSRFVLAGSVTCIFGLLGIPAAHADEITDQIQAAMALYQSGEFSRAADELDFVARRIRQLRWEALARVLPAPLPGWEIAPAESTSGAGTISGYEVACTYVAPGREIDVWILDDPPLLQSTQEWLDNPVMIANSGRRLARIGGRKALVEYRATERRGEIRIVVPGGMLVVVSGSQVAWPELESYANAVDYPAIEKIAAQ